MKALLLNPINLTIILIISSIYLLIALHFSSNRKNAELLEKLTISFFVFLLAGSSLFYLPYLNPANFSDLGIIQGEQKNFIVAQFLIYAVWIGIIRTSFRGFYHSAILPFRDLFLASLLLLTLFSASWSETPIVTLIGAVTLVAIAIFAAHVAKKFDWIGVSELLRWTISWIGILSFPVALLLPGKGRYDSGSWNGILGHKNVFGALTALGAALWYIHIQEKIKSRKLKILLVILLIIETFLSTSGGAISILIMLFSVVLSTQIFEKLEYRSKRVFIILLVISSVPITLGLQGSINIFLELLGKDTNLTGRGEFWPQVIEAINKRPLLGYGYMGFWQSWRGNENPAGSIRTITGFVPEQPHNGFLDLSTSLGYLGLALLLLSILKNFTYAVIYLGRNRGQAASIPLVMLLYLMLRNFSEAGLWRADLDFFFYVLLTVRLNLEMKQPRTLESWKRQIHQNA